MRSDVLLKPVVTEKTNEQRNDRKYVFKVDPRSNKFQIAVAIRQVFNVNPTKVNIITVPRKPKRVRYKIGKKPSWKKAIVTLPPGEDIQIFEGA